jgi:thiamine pyrophosphokinase
MPHVAVVIGGGALHADAVAQLPADAVVIAADSGLDHAVAAGLVPSMLVGDLDSISAAGRMWAYEHSVTTITAPTDKDLTDTEMALEAAAAVPDVQAITLLGGTGDRLDHLLGTLLALGHLRLAEVPSVRAAIGGTTCAVVHGGQQASLQLGPWRTFSVLALHGPAAGVTVRGAKWELHDADLGATEARGVSNETKEEWVTISTTIGVVTVVVPA